VRKQQEAFRANRIFNSYGICEAGGGTAYISYTPAGTGRDIRCAKWSVIGVSGHKPDPKGPWYDQGNKAFIGKMRSPAFEEAKAWASEKYGIKAWLKDPWGGWQDAEVLNRVVNSLKEP
jgi:hypothetical protein